ncbi:peptidoglycan-associated lipoprotein Pal [Sphingopyxis sp. MWB1]|uniref:peptidoglycan-associated lipoprotein Pal n=1 Tax=Sphingopyxis sp. MWB1 TaxID=1537715 RepID=UPI000B243FE6|nr:peptidoglycan-associated lipoprotein Pal [Sphingopyxis sp. MWB1]
MRIKKSTATLAAIAMFAVGACSKKAPEVLPPPPAGTDDGSGAGTGAGVIPGSQEDFVASVAADRIFFGFDQYNVDAEDQATLRSQAQWLQRNPAVRVTLEGHADERGTRDYNIALGERRANAAKNYLASLGVDPSRIQVISYGKERPAALGSTEEAYAQNRRAVTVIIGR